MFPEFMSSAFEFKLNFVIALALKELNARSPLFSMELDAMFTDAAKPLVEVT